MVEDLAVYTGSVILMGQIRNDKMSMYGTFVDITKLEPIEEEDGEVKVRI